MQRAAPEQAAGGQAALAAECTTDLATLRRVAGALREQIGGRPALAIRKGAGTAPADSLERRTLTPLRNVREGWPL